MCPFALGPWRMGQLAGKGNKGTLESEEVFNNDCGDGYVSV